jgi:adenosylmethionine-8-amino-7-oxononanoate aminotransferase
VAVRGEGVYVWDGDGNRYLDFSGSAAVNFIGHGVREISNAMAEQARQLEFVHTSQFTTPVAEEFAAELLDFAGEHFAGGAVYFTCGGSESVETALAGAPIPGGDRAGESPSGSEPPAELPRVDAGGARGFRQ